MNYKGGNLEFLSTQNTNLRQFNSSNLQGNQQWPNQQNINVPRVISPKRMNEQSFDTLSGGDYNENSNLKRPSNISLNRQFSPNH